MKIEITPDFKRALHLLEDTKKNLFITGRAGTGKSTLLEVFRKKTRKNVVVLAPTGVAALNVKGQTIHSFFRFKPNITLDNVKRVEKNRRDLYRKLDAIVIDEISMVRADLLDCIDKFMRLNGKSKKKPFGGVQMIFFGDLYQLPPVVKGEARKIFKKGLYKSEYFFNSKAFEGTEFEFIELEKIFRQKDSLFIEILNAIRNRTVTDEHLQILNSRVKEGFHPKPDEFYVQLTTTNALADRLNQESLKLLKGKMRKYQGYIEGDFEMGSLPADLELSLKKGAQVMLVNNGPSGRWVNGSIGKVVDFVEKPDVDITLVELTSGEVVEVTPYTWELFRYYYDKERETIASETVGTFIQYPLILAWAITIHKSQGKTFDRVIIDIGKGTFAHGQVYVALSRCTSLEGIVLRKPIQKKHIFMDWRIVRFLTSFQYARSEKRLSVEEKVKILETAMKERKKLRITYLKTNDEKSRRVIEPLFVGKLEYNGRKYLGLRAFDYLRGEERNFRIDRILEIEEDPGLDF